MHLSMRSAQCTDNVDLHVVAMPGLFGGARPLLPLCDGLARTTSARVLAVEFDASATWVTIHP